MSRIWLGSIAACFCMMFFTPRFHAVFGTPFVVHYFWFTRGVMCLGVLSFALFVFYGVLECLVVMGLRAVNEEDNIVVIGDLILLYRQETPPLTGRQRTNIRSILIRLLPLLCTDNQNVLNKAHRKAMYRLLACDDDIVILRTLQAIEKIGDVDAMPAVAKLLESDMTNQYPYQVKAAANTCLTHLQNIASQTAAVQSLLRPSIAPNAHTEILLRPVDSSSTEQTAPDQLLRAATTGTMSLREPVHYPHYAAEQLAQTRPQHS